MDKPLATVIQAATDRLKKSGIEQSETEALWLVGHLLNLSRSSLWLHSKRLIEKTDVNRIEAAIEKRASHMPHEYITGRTHFFGADFDITEAVLIPRPETELLAEKVAQTLSKEEVKNKALWDMCTGSGALAIALKKRFASLEVIGSDICPRALEVAKGNGEKNGVEIHWLQSDLFELFENKSCDFFVANPPYVSEKQYSQLAPSVRNFEPRVALVAGKEGLEFYYRIARMLKHYLKRGGRWWLEIGSDQGQAVRGIFEKEGYKEVCVGQDLAHLDRFIFGLAAT